MKTRLSFSILLILATLNLACGHAPHPRSVHETIAEQQGRHVELDADAYTTLIHRVPVQDVSLGDNPHQAFSVETRSDKLQYKPCSRCHGEQSPSLDNQAAHWERTQEHASQDIMNCRTCHDQESRMEKLHLLSGTLVDFDHAYRVCGQCHFQQQKDWIGGAHGKRLEIWAGGRIVRNCTGCHDPHKPGFPKRFPSFSPTPAEPVLLEHE